MLKVLSDALTATEKVGPVGPRCCLCVNNDILLSRLQSRFGLDGDVLAWIRSFLSDRTKRVIVLCVLYLVFLNCILCNFSCYTIHMDSVSEKNMDDDDDDDDEDEDEDDDDNDSVTRVLVKNGR